MRDQILESSPHWKINWLSLPTGIKVRVGQYQQGAQEKKKFLVFLNGRNEYIEKYSHVPLDLDLGEDVGFVTWDHRGQGKSEGSRASAQLYDLYTEDMKYILEATLPAGSTYKVMGHSMGSLIGLTGVVQEKIHPESLLLLSPLLGLPYSDREMIFVRFALKTLQALGFANWELKKNRQLPAFENNSLTSSRERYEGFINSDYYQKGYKVGWLNASIKATQFVFQKINFDFVKGAPLPSLDCQSFVLFALLSCFRDVDRQAAFEAGFFVALPRALIFFAMLW